MRQKAVVCAHSLDRVRGSSVCRWSSSVLLLHRLSQDEHRQVGLGGVGWGGMQPALSHSSSSNNAQTTWTGAQRGGIPALAQATASARG